MTFTRLPPLLVPAPLPEVVVSDVPIKVLWAARTGSSDLANVESSLREFVNLLYDCTDGQWRIGRLRIHDLRSQLPTHGRGVGHVHREEQHTPQGHADGRPDRPERWHVNETTRPVTYLMEFLHSWTGLKDEYEVVEDGARTNCPRDRKDRDLTNACVMDGTYRGPTHFGPFSDLPTELCRPSTHNPDSEQGNIRGMDCYSWLRKVMVEAGHQEFRVPPVHIPGPMTALTVRYVYLTISHPGPAGPPLTHYASVRMDGASFAPSMPGAGTWLFGLGRVDDYHARIPVRIEIWRKLSISGVPDQRLRVVEVTYDTRTGQISGDVTGTRDRELTVAPLGGEVGSGFSFVVTSR
jgi:hypothetical protein